MSRLSPIAALLVCLSSVGTLAQGPPALDTFNSPDGSFQFVYPESYDLLVGERILKASQGRRTVLPVCDFAVALACVIYPIESERETKLEAAAFSVDTVAAATNESDCLSFDDPLARSRGASPSLTSISINSRRFRHASLLRKLPGHQQAADFYRIFTMQKCYELQIQVSTSDDAGVLPQKTSRTAPVVDARANSAKESLQLILSSVIFGKE